MDLKKYEILRHKINKKDFEGQNRGLDKWLFISSFVGNVGSIFFSYFLVFPSMVKAISINLVEGWWASFLAFLFSNVFLIIFEIIKRYIVTKFSSDYVSNIKKVKGRIIGWLSISTIIIGLSFYLSLVGSKNLASIKNYKDNVAELQTSTKQDSLLLSYEKRKRVYADDNETLRNINNDLRRKLAETPLNYVGIRNQYQTNIDKNIKAIESNQNEMNKIDSQLNSHITDLKSNLAQTKLSNEDENTQNIILFIIIAIFSEALIFVGIYYREWFEYNLYVLNQQKFEKTYLKRERYKALLNFVYNDGKLNVGDKVISGLELKEMVAEHTNLVNSNKIVDEFLQDLSRIGIFVVVGKKRTIAVPFAEAQNIIEKYDESIKILENIK